MEENESEGDNEGESEGDSEYTNSGILSFLDNVNGTKANKSKDILRGLAL
jgi:hypothetical protein